MKHWTYRKRDTTLCWAVNKAYCLSCIVDVKCPKCKFVVPDSGLFVDLYISGDLNTNFRGWDHDCRPGG